MDIIALLLLINNVFEFLLQETKAELDKKTIDPIESILLIDQIADLLGFVQIVKGLLEIKEPTEEQIKYIKLAAGQCIFVIDSELKYNEDLTQESKEFLQNSKEKIEAYIS